MAVAAPARRTAPLPAPSRTTPPRRKPAPARRPATRPAPRGRPAPARAPQRARPKPKLPAGGQLIPLAVGRTAVAVGHLPDSGLVVRLTRGRAWIAVLGVLLAGIVALNVLTLSFASSSGKLAEQITTLSEENSILRGRDARLGGIGMVRLAASPLGLATPSSEEIRFIDAGPRDVTTAARRLAAAGPG